MAYLGVGRVAKVPIIVAIIGAYEKYRSSVLQNGPQRVVVRTCPGLCHYGHVKRVLAGRREGIEELARRCITGSR
jgi:hypothetical protein